MASYTETTKTADYIAVSTIESPQETKIKTFSKAAVDAQMPNIIDVSSSKAKKVRKTKKKRCLFMCCSNMQFENEEEKEKALAILEAENGKLAMVMCCSNFQVGTEPDFVPKNAGK